MAKQSTVTRYSGWDDPAYKAAVTAYDDRFLDPINRQYQKRPGAQADPEEFYTPELQQSILSQLTQQAQDRGAQAQSNISGAAVQSGFGIGNTSREAARRATADANTMDEVIGNYVNQAAQIENMRSNQAQQDQQRQFEAEQNYKNQMKDARLAAQGYESNLASTNRGYADDARAQNQNMIYGGIGDAAEGAASLYVNRSQPQPGTTFIPGYGQAADTRKAIFSSPTEKQRPIGGSLYGY